MIGGSFVERFRAIAASTPDAIALESEAERLSYRELDDRAGRLAARLRAIGAGPESVVGICLGKSPAHVVAMLGAWYARAAFLPLDPALPRERLAFMAHDAGARTFVATAATRAQVDGLGTIVTDACDGPRLDPQAAFAGDLAWVIYTSGSTGTPKGVLVEQRGVVNLLDSQIAAFRVTRSSRALLFLSTSFDASISDIGTTLLAGATLCFVRGVEQLAPPALLEVLGSRRITHVDLPPALLARLDANAAPSTLEAVVIGGEPCPPDAVRRWAARVRLVNVYGPTEATVCTSLVACDPDSWSRPLLGEPIARTKYRVVDDELRDVPAGAPGELLIAGIGLARGYANRPELNERRFISLGGERLYRTGDRVVAHEDGGLEFLGRVDRQVKVRGLLVAPEELELALASHPSVHEAAVVKRPLRSGGRDVLVAFVANADPERSADFDELATHLATTLPKWMLPQRWVPLAALPRTRTGKLDLDALVALPLARALPTGRAARTPDELALASIWAAVLDLDEVGVDEDFFALGGDSLAVLDACAAAESRGIALSPGALQAHRTIAGVLAARARDAGDVMTTEAIRVLAQLDDVATSAEPAPTHPPADILLTGATGFLGSRLAGELLSRTDAELWCLVRGSSVDEARRRVLDAMHAHGLEGDTGRMHFVLGDVSRQRLGLEEAEWARLASRIDTVHHCAAHVNMVLPWAALEAANVAGTRHVLDFASHGRAKRLHYASTLSVFVSTDRHTGRLAESDDLSHTRFVFGGYAQTKFAAELLVRAHSREAASYRLGLVTGDTRTGHSAPADFLSMFFRGVATLGCVPVDALERLHVDVTPVDYAAAAMAHLSLAPRRGTSTFHVANPSSVSVGQLVEAMREEGLRVATIDVDEWRRRIASRAVGMGTAEAAAFLALCRALDPDAFVRQRTIDLFQATGAQFATDATDAALAGSGLACPRADETLLRTYVRHALSTGAVPTRRSA